MVVHLAKGASLLLVTLLSLTLECRAQTLGVNFSEIEQYVDNSQGEETVFEHNLNMLYLAGVVEIVNDVEEEIKLEIQYKWDDQAEWKTYLGERTVGPGQTSYEPVICQRESVSIFSRFQTRDTSSYAWSLHSNLRRSGWAHRSLASLSGKETLRVCPKAGLEVVVQQVV